MWVFLWLFCGVLSAAYDIQYDLKRGVNYTVNKIMGSLIIILFGPFLGLFIFVISLNNSRRILIKAKKHTPSKRED